jgi:mannose-6-phosphate isomerase-like protein (cupin superfamily)
MKESTSFKDSKTPLINPSGEVVYELLRGVTHTVAYIVIPPGKSSSAHYHRISEESYVILEGNAILVIDGREIPINQGHSMLIEKGEIHQISNLGDQDLEFLAICVPPWVPDDSYPPGDVQL